MCLLACGVKWGVRMSTWMPTPQSSYLLVLAVPAYRLNANEFAVESAFAEHLRLLKRELGELAPRIVLVSPLMDETAFRRQKSILTSILEQEEGIHHRPTVLAGKGRKDMLLSFLPVVKRLWAEVLGAHVVHGGPSTIYQPFEYLSLLLAVLAGRNTIFVADIDHRETSRMNLQNGTWSKRQFWVNHLFHDRIRHAQIASASKMFSLVLLKGAAMARDYGRGASNVKNHLDSAYSSEHLLDEVQLEARLSRLDDPSAPLELCYFGRLVEYKGIDHMLQAVSRAIKRSERPLRFHIIGDGPDDARLRDLVISLNLNEVVSFHGPVPFGPTLFETLQLFDILLAAPLAQDTPRSALDAMACGQAVLAYDTYYYRDLEGSGAGVLTSPWGEIEMLASSIANLASNPESLRDLAERSRRFALENTQEIWLARRVEWTRDVIQATRARLSLGKEANDA